MTHPSSGLAGSEDSASDSSDPIQQLVRFAHRLHLSDVPLATTDAMKLRIVDVIAAGLAGMDAEGIGALRELARHWGGRPEASMLGDTVQVPAPVAALVNAAGARAREFDDVHEKALLHPTVGVVPVALAAAEARGGVDGEEFLAAVIAATEVTCRLGLAPEYHVAGSAHRPRGWSYSYQCATLGGAMAAARLSGCSLEQHHDAVGNAYTALAGNQQAVQEGVLAVRVQQGICAQTALQSALLAARGITGPRQVLEGVFGWLRHWHGDAYDTRPLLQDLGVRWEIENISIKPYPCGRITHNAVQATIDTMAANRIVADDVRRLVVHVNSRESWEEVVQGVERRRKPVTPIEAQFSLPFLCAVAAVRGSVRLLDLDTAAIQDAAVLAFAQRVEPVMDEAADQSSGRVIPMPVQLDFELDDGTVVVGRCDFSLGHPNNPVSWSRVEAKLSDCASWASGWSPDSASSSTRSILAAVKSLEDYRDVGDFAREVALTGVSLRSS